MVILKNLKIKNFKTKNIMNLKIKKFIKEFAVITVQQYKTTPSDKKSWVVVVCVFKIPVYRKTIKEPLDFYKNI